MRIIFVYAGQPNSGIIQTPYAITDHLYNFLCTKAEVIYFDWQTTTDFRIAPTDLVLGHPHYNPDTAIQRFFQQPCRAKFLLNPFHTNRMSDNWPFNHLIEQANKFFAICGPYWYDTITETPFAAWKPKITRLDLAVDPKIYPHLKTTFNPPSARRLVYIGSSTPNKNLNYLIKIMQNLPHVTLHWYGGDLSHPLAKLPNVRTTGWITLNETNTSQICHWCDIMVSVSDSDANPTTLLETTALGLIAACTKESGYYNDPMFTELYLNDFGKTIKALKQLLAEPSENLLQRSHMNRHKIETYYTWDRFCASIWAGIQEFV